MKYTVVKFVTIKDWVLPGKCQSPYLINNIIIILLMNHIFSGIVYMLD